MKNFELVLSAGHMARWRRAGQLALRTALCVGTALLVSNFSAPTPALAAGSREGASIPAPPAGKSGIGITPLVKRASDEEVSVTLEFSGVRESGVAVQYTTSGDAALLSPAEDFLQPRQPSRRVIRVQIGPAQAGALNVFTRQSGLPGVTVVPLGDPAAAILRKSARPPARDGQGQPIKVLPATPRP